MVWWLIKHRYIFTFIFVCPLSKGSIYIWFSQCYGALDGQREVVVRVVYTLGDMHSETQRGLANSPSSLAVSYIMNAYSALHYSGQSKQEVPYFTAAPTHLVSLFLSLSVLSLQNFGEIIKTRGTAQ
jgi:hypothetical protein